MPQATDQQMQRFADERPDNLPAGIAWMLALYAAVALVGLAAWLSW